MSILIIYGTESGNSELVADDIATAIADRGPVRMCDMSNFDIRELSTEQVVLVICSTHGEGELPSGATPFADALDRHRPNLVGMHYAVFGLGDSSYKAYSRGSELIDERLRMLGAHRIGPYGRHDASSRNVASDLAVQWAKAVLAAVANASVPTK